MTISIGRRQAAVIAVSGRRWTAILTDEEAAVLVKATHALVADSGFTARERLDLRRATAAFNAARMVR
jgi:hypothetical protein